MRYQKGTFMIVPNKHVLAGQPAYVQSVYFWVCEYANENGLCFPSMKTLSEKAGTSLSSVIRAINTLTELGIVAKESRKSGKENLSNMYQLLISRKEVVSEGHDPSCLPDTVTQPIINSLSTEKRVFSSFSKKSIPPKRKFGTYNESDPADDLPSVNAETGEVAEEPKKTREPKNKLALDAMRYFGRAGKAATGTEPLSNEKGYFLVLRSITTARLDAKLLRKRIDDWFASGQPIEKLVQITHCFSDYSINDWKVKNNLS